MRGLVKQLYDHIGHGYGGFRRPDPRIQQAILDGLGESRSVINVGAGAGSYEPDDRWVCALDPSTTMIRQRRVHAAPAVRASALDLPFRDGVFDAALAILTVHHWPDQARGLSELRRVAARVVILTKDTSRIRFWLMDYFPELLDNDRRDFPPIDTLQQKLGPTQVSAVPIPHDCKDGFLGAYWRRPDAYLDSERRAAISGFCKLRDPEPGLSRLRVELENGEWQRKYGHLLSQPTIDIGYRLVVAG